MTSLILFNSSESMPFLALFAVFSFIISAIFMGIVTIWMILKQKISDEISASKILKHMMLATPQKCRKYWEDLITSKKPVIMILAKLDL
jgi:hypothetical protein